MTGKLIVEELKRDLSLKLKVDRNLILVPYYDL